ncbi:MAG TPA: hypothetical protein VGQ36_13665 [Thermoanaerobaculia bacterium]|jgi:hypothetical protein|nr:hypothetical protein [Thermoanaerobaculia bacterium]
MQVFLSCSLSSEDADVVELIRTVCQGLGLQCVTVDTAAAAAPPAEARQLMRHSDGVIAIATCRDRLSETEFAMPASVREEMAMAFAMHAPLLPLVEAGVRTDGMFRNFATSLTFDRRRLTTNEAIGKIIRAISSFKAILESKRQLDQRRQRTGGRFEVIPVVLAIAGNTLDLRLRIELPERSPRLMRQWARLQHHRRHSVR